MKALLSSEGIDVTPQNKSDWVNRNKKLPRRLVAILSAELAERNIPFKATDFDVQQADEGTA